MDPAADCLAALVTAPDMETARMLARAALEEKLAACANIIPNVESHYWWQGKIEQSAEALIVFKTTAANREGLQRCVLAKHPYDTAEFITLPVTGGGAKYLDWLRASVR